VSPLSKQNKLSLVTAGIYYESNSLPLSGPMLLQCKFTLCVNIFKELRILFPQRNMLDVLVYLISYTKH